MPIELPPCTIENPCPWCGTEDDIHTCTDCEEEVKDCRLTNGNPECWNCTVNYKFGSL